MTHAGKHLLAELYQCECIPSIENIKNSLASICKEIGATVLFTHAHEFDGGGSSGVVILAESHCTWHHWIDEKYIALDLFVCGTCNPSDAQDMLLKLFKPKRTKFDLYYRGEGYQNIS